MSTSDELRALYPSCKKAYSVDLIQSKQLQHEANDYDKADDINDGVHIFP